MRRFRCAIVLLSLLLEATVACGQALPRPRTRHLTILHTNDLHARFLPDDEDRGGFAYLATAIRQQRADSDGALVLMAGDLVQGTPVSTIFEGLPCFEVANLMGFDVAVLGNHEFDYGWGKILEFQKTAMFPIVSANVANARGELLIDRPYVVREVNRLRVGVIGVVTAGLGELTKAQQRGPWKVLPVVETVRDQARKLRQQVDMVVALGHLYEQEEDAILRDAPEVDVLVSGHSHGGQTEVKELDGRIGVKVRAYGVELGRLDLDVDPERKRVISFDWRRIPVTSEAQAPDQAVARAVEAWEAKVSELVDVPIGVAERRIERSEVRRMIERAMLDAVGGDIAYMNAGGVRDVIPKGEILARQVWNILPFGNAIVYGRFRGKNLPEEVDGRDDIDPDAEYVFVTNDFMADQWSERKGFRDLKQGPLVREALIDWIKATKRIR